MENDDKIRNQKIGYSLLGVCLGIIAGKMIIPEKMSEFAVGAIALAFSSVGLYFVKKD